MLRRNFFALNFRLLVIGLFCLCLSLNVAAQNVDIAGALGGVNGTYATLQAAFAAINGTATQAGQNITVTIKNNTTETVSAVLNQNAGPWNTLTIIPQGVVSVSGNLAAPLVDLNGADRVTVNGNISGVRSLTFDNASTDPFSAAFRLINEATQNTITYCNIKSSTLGQMATTTHGAVIWFSTTNTSAGNSSNTISYNDIGPSGSNLPYICIRSNGTATTTTHNNRLVTISNNLIHDYFYYGGTQSNANGIFATTGTDAWTITNNRIYQTASRTYTTGGSGSVDRVVYGVNIRIGGGYTISGNIIGFGNSGGTGFSTFLQGASNIASMFQGIVISGGATLSTIDGNTIAGIDITSSRATATVRENIFLGIFVEAGTVNVSNNTIGSMAGGNSILIRSTAITSTAPVPAAGIYIQNATSTVSSNSLGGIALVWTMPPGTTGNDRTSLFGIYSTASATKIIGNTVGSSFANSLSNSSTQGNVIGIATANGYTGGVIRQNIVRNISHLAANSGFGNSASAIGILNQPGAGTDTLAENQVFNIANTAVTTALVNVYGIRQSPVSSGNNYCVKNWVHSISAVSTSSATTLSGINTGAAGNHHLQNNMISLGSGVSQDYVISGIRQDAGNAFVYYNSIRISGSVSAGSNNTYAYFHTPGSTVQFRAQNNIYYNQRTGGSGKHYAVCATIAPTSWSSILYSRYNLFYTTATPLARYLTTDCNDLSAWNIQTTQDPLTTSLQAPVVFTSITDLHTSDYIVRNAGSALGLPVVITQDIDNFTRPSCVDIGCDEYDPGSIAGNTWTWLGTVDNIWCTPCNWDRETAPVATSDVLILDDRPRYPLLQAACGNVAVNHFTIANNATPAKSGQIDLATYTLAVSGNVTIKGTCFCTGSTPFTALTSGLLDVTGTGAQQILDIRSASDTYPGSLCKLRINKTQPTNVASANHEAILKGNLLILYNLDFSNGVLISQSGSTYDADELTANNFKTITVFSDEPNAVTRQNIAAQNTRNGYFEGRLNRKVKSGGGDEYLFPLGYRRSGGTGIVADNFYTPALIRTNSVANNQYLVATFLGSNSNGTVDGVGIGFTGHGCANAFEIDDQGGQTATTCNNAEIDMVANFYWDFQESTGATANGNPVISGGALGIVDYDLECAGDKFNLLAMDGLTGSELRLMNRPSATIPGNTGQGSWVSTNGSHNGVDLSANTGIAMYSINAASLQGSRRDGLTSFGGFVAAGNGPSPLPVELLYFNAEAKEGRNVLCRWETATEINNDYFEVEAAREQEGNLRFESIGRVSGNGTSSTPHAYAWLDTQALKGRNYYRLKQVDYDGTIAYSKTVVVLLNGSKSFEVIGISPNPFYNQANLFVQVPASGNLEIHISNTLGQSVYAGNRHLAKGSNSFDLAIEEGLAAGVYYVQLTFDREQTVVKLIKN